MRNQPRRLFIWTLSASLGTLVHAQGVLILNAAENDLMPIDSSAVFIDVEDQVALVQSTQYFINASTDTVFPKYAYPLPEAASAVKLRWFIDGLWNEASMVAQPPDTTLPGVGTGQGGPEPTPELLAYLGETPLYFRLITGIPPGATIAVELTYVQLMEYGNAHVELQAGTDQSSLWNGVLSSLRLFATVRSQRDITGIDVHGTGAWISGPATAFVSADSASLHLIAMDVPSDHRLSFEYDLDPLGYGLISMSNYLPDSMMKCDELGNGFFVLLIEPEPTSDVIEKDFVIVIDKSGSMEGSKLVEAKDAAAFMVNNLNIGDLFNVIAFDSQAISWSTGLQPFNASTQTTALQWISQIQADGGTNINSAVSMGIGNYTTSVPDHARPLIFLTDGQANESNQEILANASQLRLQIAPDLQLFTFGIGDGFNEQLLNQLAVQNNGASQFLQAANFSELMGDFYTQIQDPVLLAPTASFDQPDIQNVHPQTLMGLFVGQQMILVGRYDVPGLVDLHLEGTAAGVPVSFDYPIDLSGTFDEGRTFIPKIWAQQAIGALLNEYYAYPFGSELALSLEDSISSYSMCYGISSPFTSFVDDGGGSIVGVEEMDRSNPLIALTYPEPSSVNGPVTFDLQQFAKGERLEIRITDMSGRLILVKYLTAEAGGQWVWDGLDTIGRPVTGQLVYHLITGNGSLVGRFTRI